MTVDIEKLEALANAFPELDFDNNTEPFFNGPSGESLGGGSTGFYCVYGQPFEIDGDQYDGNEYVSVCTKEFAEFMCAAKPSVLELIAELKQAEEDNVTWKGGISALGEAMKKLTFCARTVTDGPDNALMAACEAAENALSLGGVSRAIDYIEGLKSEIAQIKVENACLLDKYQTARDRKNSVTLLQAQRDRLLEALQEIESGSGTSPGANKKYQRAREAIAFATGKVKS